MRKTALRKKSKSSLKKLKDTLWELCKRIVRKRDGNTCVICKKSNLEGSGWHTGHFIASSTCGAFLRYNLRNLHSSCYNCNINLGGNGALFLVALEGRYSRDFVDSVIKDKQKVIQADSIFYEGEIKKLIEIQYWSKDKLFDYTRNL